MRADTAITGVCTAIICITAAVAVFVLTVLLLPAHAAAQSIYVQPSGRYVPSQIDPHTGDLYLYGTPQTLHQGGGWDRALARVWTTPSPASPRACSCGSRWTPWRLRKNSSRGSVTSGL